MGRCREVSSGRPRDGQIGSLGDVQGVLAGNVVGTSWGQIFAGWERLLLFYQKTVKTTTLPQVNGDSTPNLVLKRMLRYFLQIPPLMKILQFKDRISFFY